VAINDISLKLDSLAYTSAAESVGVFSTTFTYALIRLENYIRRSYAAVRVITPFKVIQGHRVW